MKFVALLAGVILLAVGLVAYLTIPNTHNIPVETFHNIVHDKDIQVSSYSSTQTPENVTIVVGKSNNLLVNATVALGNGGLSSVQLKIFSRDKFQSCMLDSQPTGCLYDRPVSNGTITIPLNQTTIYYFGFDNTSSNSSKTVTLSASVETMSINTLVTKDGSWNLTGLGISAIGLVIMLYGAVSRTIIPWE